MLNKKINFGIDSYLGMILPSTFNESTGSFDPRTLEEIDEERRELREKDKLIALQVMNKETINPSINQK